MRRSSISLGRGSFRRRSSIAAACGLVIAISVLVAVLNSSRTNRHRRLAAASGVTAASSISIGTETPVSSVTTSNQPSTTLPDPKSSVGPTSATSTGPDGAVTYFGVGAVVSPAPSYAVPTISRQDALTDLYKNGVLQNVAQDPSPPDSLTLVTYENKFGAKGADDSMTPSVPAQLAWYAVYKNVRSNPISGPQNPHESPGASQDASVANAPGTTCNLYAAVSASTSAGIVDSFRICDQNLPG